jgi:hypothetical protein
VQPIAPAFSVAAGCLAEAGKVLVAGGGW